MVNETRKHSSNEVIELPGQVLKLGQINFINCLPINLPIERNGFGELATKYEFEILDSVPSELNTKLANGELDLAPISSYEYLRNKENYKYLEGISISSKIKADSVLFFCDLDFWNKPNKVIHVTNKSATSVNLLKIILKELYKFDLSQIRFKVFDLSQKYDAKLLIGDEALKEDTSKYEEVIDLGEKWYELTGLPMVFALWTVNKNSQIHKDPKLFQKINNYFLQMRDIGFNDLYPDMIIEAFRETGLNRTRLKQYFNNLDYGLTEKHKESLALFEEYISKLSQNSLIM